MSVGAVSHFFSSIEPLNLKRGAHLNAVNLCGPLPVADLESGSPHQRSLIVNYLPDITVFLCIHGSVCLP